MERSKARFSFGFERFSGLYLGALFIIAFTIMKPHLFATMSTVHTVAAQQAISGIIAIAVLVPLITGTYDLSVGSVANLSTIMVIWLQTTHDLPVPVAIGLTLLISAAIGLVNGFIVVKLHVNSFIATLGMGSIIVAVQSIVSGNTQPLPAISSGWLHLTQQKLFGFQIVFVYLVVVALLFWWVLDHTPLGRYLYAIGSSADAARLSGVNVGKWVWLSLVSSATLSGLGGVLYGSLSGPSLTYGQSLLLPAFAAVFLGSTQLKPGRFNLWGTLIAIYVLAIGVKGLSYITGVQWLNAMFNGVALILAVAFAVWRQSGPGRRRRASAMPAADEQPTNVTDSSHREASPDLAVIEAPSTQDKPTR